MLKNYKKSPSVSSTMQIWFYEHECQVGDYVYADGSFSDKLDKRKTPVGVCFYINPSNKSERLCVSMNNRSSCQWGLYTADWGEGINLADNPSYDPFDIQTLTNKLTSGLNGNVIGDDNYRDSTAGDADGFKIFSPGTALAELGWESLPTQLGNYQEGTRLPIGMINTLKIIAHRDTILADSNVQLPIPHAEGGVTEEQYLNQYIQDVVSRNGGQSKYQQYYYPAASQCHAYEPIVATGETLADKFQAGLWFLPSVGELARIFWYLSKGLERGKPNAIFANAYNDFKFTAFVGSWYCSSTEPNNSTSWCMLSPDGNLSNHAKNVNFSARPIAAF